MIRRRHPIRRKHGTRLCVNCQRERLFVGRSCSWCKRSEPRPSKYHAAPKRDSTGAMRHSTLEADYGSALAAAQAAGEISDLRAQVRLRLEVYGVAEVEVLLEALEAQSREMGCCTPRIAALRRAVRLSKRHICDMIVDFAYRDKDGVERHDDPKGIRQGPTWSLFQLKRRLARACHGIEVQPVGKPRWGRGA